MLAILLSPEPPFRPPADTVEHEARVAGMLRRVSWLRGRLAGATAWIYGAVIAPFVDFMKRRGWLLILVFIVVFKFGDALLGRMSGVFYRELGFSLVEIAEVMKVYGFIANGNRRARRRRAGGAHRPVPGAADRRPAGRGHQPDVFRGWRCPATTRWCSASP
jgi:hypothetical protein